MAATGAQKATTDSPTAQSTPRNAAGVGLASAGVSTEWISRSDRREDRGSRSSWGARWAAMHRSSAGPVRHLRPRNLAILVATPFLALVVACFGAAPALDAPPSAPATSVA